MQLRVEGTQSFASDFHDKKSWLEVGMVVDLLHPASRIIEAVFKIPSVGDGTGALVLLVSRTSINTARASNAHFLAISSVHLLNPPASLYPMPAMKQDDMENVVGRVVYTIEA